MDFVGNGGDVAEVPLAHGLGPVRAAKGYAGWLRSLGTKIIIWLEAIAGDLKQNFLKRLFCCKNVFKEKRVFLANVRSL